MKNNLRNLITAALLFVFVALGASATQAQWQRVDADNDAVGHLIFYKERNPRGDFRTMSRQYFPGTHVINTERTTIQRVNGVTIVVFERRDRLNRVTFISNETTNGNVLTQGVRQRWTYRDERDRRGLQTNEEYDRQARQWRRF